MKRTFTIVAVLTALFSMTACGHMHRDRDSNKGYDSGTSSRSMDSPTMDPSTRQGGGTAGGVRDAN
jgi:hypothetical protein